MVKCLYVIHLSVWFSKCIFMFLSCRINVWGCCCVKWLYAWVYPCVCVYGQHVDIFSHSKKGQHWARSTCSPVEFLMVFFQMDNFIFLIFNFFCVLLFLSTANTGHQGMLYNYNKILKCHIELYSYSTFKVFNYSNFVIQTLGFRLSAVHRLFAVVHIFFPRFMDAH